MVNTRWVMADMTFKTAGTAMAAVVAGLAGQAAVAADQQDAAKAQAISQFEAAEPFGTDPTLDVHAPAEVFSQPRLPFEKA